MTVIVLAAAVGLVFGVACGVLHLPLPAPTSSAGVVGVIALYVGWRTGGWVHR